jgi:hypothetical protein
VRAPVHQWGERPPPPPRRRLQRRRRRTALLTLPPRPRRVRLQDPQERAQAELALKPFATAEYAPHCKAVLDASASPYAQLLAASSLLRIVAEQPLAPEVKLEMRGYFLRLLEARGAALEPFVAAQLLQLLARMTKLCWFEDDAYRGIVDDGKALLDRGATVRCCFLLVVCGGVCGFCVCVCRQLARFPCITRPLTSAAHPKLSTDRVAPSRTTYSASSSSARSSRR